MTTSSNSFSGGLSMSTKAIQCPKCNGEMVQGFIFDRTDGGTRRVINWVEGEPGHCCTPGLLFSICDVHHYWSVLLYKEPGC